MKVTDYYDLPDCLTYQNADPGRACVPEKGATANSVFRATNYPVGAVDPRDPTRSSSPSARTSTGTPTRKRLRPARVQRGPA